MGTGGRNTLIAFGAAVTLWVLPGAVGLVTGGESATYDWLLDHLDGGAVAIFAALLLFVLPSDWGRREFTLNWNDAVKIDWGTIILFGSGIALGGLLSSTGLAETMGTGLSDLLGTDTLVGITILATVIAVIISETTSTTASVVVVAPIAAQLALAADVNPAIPVLAAIFGASFGFMLPVSTPPNAIVDRHRDGAGHAGAALGHRVRRLRHRHHRHGRDRHGEPAGDRLTARLRPGWCAWTGCPTGRTAAR